MHFTTRMIQDLQPAPRRFEIRESGGLTLRVTPHGAKTWSLVWRRQGRLKRATLGRFPAMSLAEARQAGQALRAARVQVADAAATRLDWNELARRYVQRRARPADPTWRSERALLEHRLLPLWSGRDIASVGSREIRRLLAEVAVATPVTADLLLRLIRRLYAFAFRQGWLAHDPCEQLAVGNPPTPGRRILGDHEMRLLWHHLGNLPAQPRTGLALKLVAVTGWRIGEVVGLRWDEIDFGGRCWRPGRPTPSSPEGRPLPLSGLAAALLGSARLLAGESPWVLPGTAPDRPLVANTLGNALRRHRSALPLAAFSPDDLRRTAAPALRDPEAWAAHLRAILRNPASACCPGTAVSP